MKVGRQQGTLLFISNGTVDAERGWSDRGDIFLCDQVRMLFPSIRGENMQNHSLSTAAGRFYQRSMESIVIQCKIVSRMSRYAAPPL